MNPSIKTLQSKSKQSSPWLDVLAIFAWGILLLKYTVTGQLKLLIHPNYAWLVFITSIALLLLSIIKASQIIKTKNNNLESRNAIEHITLFPPNLSSGLLIATAILGLSIAPTVLNSQTALQRGVTESLPIVRSQPQSFRTSTKPEERSLIDWVRTVNAYPEPDAYTGQQVKVTGFVVHLPNLPDNYVLISRFVVTCCAVDAYPVGIPVKLQGSRSAFAPDTWVELEGKMITETLSIDRVNLTKSPGLAPPVGGGVASTQSQHQERQLVISASSLKKIPTPSDPYAY
ncbi:MAG: TIGR03943 family putative permease subunit [Xenococcaceae cyanobacterium]